MGNFSNQFNDEWNALGMENLYNVYCIGDMIHINRDMDDYGDDDRIYLNIIE